MGEQDSAYTLERDLGADAKAQLRRDVQFLSNELKHRGANTESERRAAEWIAGRLQDYTPDVEVDDFHTIDSPRTVFAAFYVEFIIVAFLSYWIPWIMFGYGVIVFLCYLGEVSGYPNVSRLFPQFESQNVVARFMGVRPRRLIVVTAHYDSPRTTPLRQPDIEPRLRVVHLVLVTCMVMVLAGCAAEAVGTGGAGFAVLAMLKWLAGLALASVGLFVIYFETQSEYTRGASDNASGVAALLWVARDLSERPPENADVWLVATGSHDTWMSGMRRLLRSYRFDKRETVFLNLHNVGAGKVCYVRQEGVLYPFRSGKTLLTLADAQHAAGGVQPLDHEGLPTDALLPLIRGFEAMTVTTRDDRLAREWDIREMDESNDVDYNTVLAASRFTETLVRRLDYTAPD